MSNGTEPDEGKISIVGLPAPEDKKGVQRLLGLVNYVAKFIPNLSEKTVPLKELLAKNMGWCWGEAQVEAWKPLRKSRRCWYQKDVWHIMM